MRIKNNRRGLYQWIMTTFFVVGIDIFIIVMNAFVSNNPDHSVGFYLVMILLILMPIIIGVPYLVLSAKTIAIEHDGVSEYRKGKLVKLLKYDEIELIRLSNSTIYIQIPKKSDDLYDNIGSINALFKLLVSKDSRKRCTEHIITFANNKKGFEEYELPFLVEIAKRCEFRVSVEHIGDFRSEKRVAMLNKSFKEACQNHIEVKNIRT